MEKVPLYLTWYFLKIRRHKMEEGYLEKRFAKMEKDKMCLETQMLNDLHKRGLIALSEKRLEKVFDPLVYSPSPGIVVHRAGTEYRVPYPSIFDITPAGHYFIREKMASAITSISWTIIAAAVGGFVGAYF